MQTFLYNKYKIEVTLVDLEVNLEKSPLFPSVSDDTVTLRPVKKL